MILNEFGSAVFGSIVAFDSWCIKNNLSHLRRKVNYVYETENEHKIYDNLISQGCKVKISPHTVNGNHCYTYITPISQEEKERYWQHRLNFQYLYIANWMKDIEAAERWFHESYDEPCNAKKQEAEFCKAHKPKLPYCITKGNQCSFLCPYYAEGCQITAEKEQEIKNFIKYYKK